MRDYTDLQKAAEYAAQDVTKFADEGEEMRALQQFHEEVDPETVLVLIAENQALKGPHDWLAEDLIKELVDNAQAIQENADDGEEDEFFIVLLAAAQRIRRQEANIEKLKADVVLSAKAADCWDRLNVQNKALSDSFRAERDQAEQDYKDVVGTIELRDIEISKLRAEVAGLRTGYEAYERVNAELKAEVRALRGLTETAQKGAELLSKDAGRYRWLLQNRFTMSSEYMGGVSFQTGRSRWSDLPDEAVSEAIDAALGQGEQS